MSSTAEKRSEFRRLHEAGCFVMPNPWDAGTARYLQSLNFPALATTSAGAAWSMGFADGDVPLNEMLRHIRQIVDASDVPVSADYGKCFADEPAAVASNVKLAIATGVAGVSIEDATGQRAQPQFSIEQAVARVKAARQAIDETETGVVLTARAENFLVGKPDLDDALARVSAYAQAGADCLYVPGIRSREQIRAVVRAVAPKPVNLLVAHAGEFSVQEIGAMGVRRISVGSGLSRAVWGTIMRAARGIAEGGRFDGFADAASNPDLNEFFRTDRARRGAS